MTTVWSIGDSTVARNNIHSYPQTGMDREPCQKRP